MSAREARQPGQAWLALALLLLLALPAAARAEIGVQRIPVGGGVTLEANVLRPAGFGDGQRTPVVFDAGPYFGEFQAATNGAPASPPGPSPAEYGILARGYTVVEVSLRGYGGSGGCWDYHGSRDRADMAAVIDWLAKQPWSDGNVGVVGFSYDGGAAVDAIASRHPSLRAAILSAPQDSYSGLYLNDVRAIRPGLAPAFGPGLTAADLSGPALGGDEVENLTTADPACWAQNIANIAQPDASTPWWRDRDALAHITGATVPTLLSYGFLDDSVKTGYMLPLWNALHGPKQAWFGQFDHTPADGDLIWPAEGTPLVGRGGFHSQKLRFLARHLRGVDSAEPEPPVVIQEGTSGRWRGASSWPPAVVDTSTLTLRPGSYADAPGNSADGRGPNLIVADAPSVRQGVGSWTLSAPLATARHLAGRPRLRVDASAAQPGAHLVALLYDVAANGQATIVSRHARTVAASGPTELTLYPQDWRFAPGHRIGLLLTGADDSWVEPGHTGQTVTVAGGTLSLPTLPAPATYDVAGGRSWAMDLAQPIAVPAEARRRAGQRLRIRRAR